VKEGVNHPDIEDKNNDDETNEKSLDGFMKVISQITN
jgi:hypothetical protein